jgi:hypothetical protein
MHSINLSPFELWPPRIYKIRSFSTFYWKLKTDMLGERRKNVFRTGKMFKTVGDKEHMEIGRLLIEENLGMEE